jgi:hypothetical protein
VGGALLFVFAVSVTFPLFSLFTVLETTGGVLFGFVVGLAEVDTGVARGTF